MNNRNKGTAVITGAAALAVIIGVSLFLAAAGDIDFVFGEDSLTVHTALWKDVTVRYEDIAAIESVHCADAGKRTNGFGSGRLNLGEFRNDEFGDYLLYEYTGCEELVVMTLRDGSVIALGGKDPGQTAELFDALNEAASDAGLH